MSFRSAVNSRLVVAIAFIATLCLGALARMSQSVGPLYGEESIFAEIALNKPAGPDYILAGRVKGLEERILAEHPAMLYEAVKVLGGFLPAHAPDTVVRQVFAAPSVLFFALLAAHAARRSLANAAIVCSLCLSGLMVRASTSPQLDASVGLAFVAAPALALVLAPMSMTAALAGGFCLGLGKQEWSLAAVVAAGILWRVSARRFRWLDFFVAGIVAGNVASALYHPLNYLGGWDVLWRTTFTAGEVSPLRNWVRKIANAQPWFPTLGAGLAFLFARSVARTAKDNALPLFLSSWSLLLFLGFLASPWAREERYYAPAMLVLAAACASEATIKGALLRFLVAFAAIGLADSLSYALRRSPTFVANPAHVHPSDCLPLEPHALAWREGDFLAPYIPEDRKANLRTRGYRICGEEPSSIPR